MASILDLGAVLMAQGTYSTGQSFPPLQLFPRQLATSAVVITLQTPPVSAATFTIEVASASGGVYTPVGALTWPAGIVGSKQLPVGVNSSRAWIANNQATWVRLTLTTTGALTGSCWVSKSSDGGPGLGADVMDAVNAL